MIGGTIDHAFLIGILCVIIGGLRSAPGLNHPIRFTIYSSIIWALYSIITL